jgi:Mg2+ and Co2+ transporter CorA
MNSYLDSDSARRQANTVLRLTVVTILGLIGTVATGVLGMNIIDESSRPIAVRLVIFAICLAATVLLTVVTVANSKRFADAIDALSDSRVSWGSKWKAMRRAWKSAQ